MSPARARRLASFVLIPSILLAALLCIAGSTHVEAQTDHHLSLALTAGYSDVSTPDEPRTLQGILYGVEASTSWSRFRLSGEYRLGRLESGDGDGLGRRVSSLRAAFGARVLPWIVIEGGPRMSIVELPLEDRKIVRWRVGVIAEAPLVADLVTGYASAAGSFAGTGIGGMELPRSGGGEVGLVVEPVSNLWARVGYRYDREYLPLLPSQAFETTFVSIGVFMPRRVDDGENR